MGLVWTYIRGSTVALLMGLNGFSVAHAEPSLTILSALPAQSSVDRVIDLRDAEHCTAGSLPGARCVPATHFINAEGKTIGFHALRWLLGTVGLTGDETVLLLGPDAETTQAVAQLFHTAGQHRVLAYGGGFSTTDDARPGTERSFSRETVYIAPMRVN